MRILTVQRYSRLVIDCNRPRVCKLIHRSRATTIPAMKASRGKPPHCDVLQDLRPLSCLIDDISMRDGTRGCRRLLVSLHSFTPVYAGIARPWHIGTLYQRDMGVAASLLEALRASLISSSATTSPTPSTDETDYTIPVHAEARRADEHGIEIRQDLISHQAARKHGATDWRGFWPRSRRRCGRGS